MTSIRTTSVWAVQRCTADATVNVHLFDNQFEAENACRKLIRMTSTPREYWYEVAEEITLTQND
jgi:hypothetical protein